MEWVVTSGRTIEEATEHALDQLGVDEQDAEVEVVQDAQKGLFGRLRAEAQVRGVRPTAPGPRPSGASGVGVTGGAGTVIRVRAPKGQAEARPRQGRWPGR